MDIGKPRTPDDLSREDLLALLAEGQQRAAAVVYAHLAFGNAKFRSEQAHDAYARPSSSS